MKVRLFRSMSSDRQLFRNVYFYNAANPGGGALGGLVQNGLVMEASFLDMLGIILITESPIPATHRTSHRGVSRTDSSLPIGTYDISCRSVYLCS